MGAIKGRVKRLASGPLGEKVRQKRRAERRDQESRAAFLYFMNAFTKEIDTEDLDDKVWAVIEPWFWQIHDWPYLPKEAPLLARLACDAKDEGWFPSPLPAAWVRAVLDNPTAEEVDCGRCGLQHPSGGYSWKDCRPVFAPPFFPNCLHCGEPMGEVEYGKVAEDYYRRHNRSHPYPELTLGRFLLKGGDPNQFDPLRDAK